MVDGGVAVLEVDAFGIAGVGEHGEVHSLDAETVLPCQRTEGMLEVLHLAVAVVIAEVEVGAEFAEERHLQVELKITDALVYGRLAGVVVDHRHGVDGHEGVDLVAGGVFACKTAIVDVCGPVVEDVAAAYGQGGVEAECASERALVVVVADVCALEVDVDAQKVIEELRGEVD